MANSGFQTKTQLATHKIRSLIAEGVYPPGSSLRSRELSELLGVSATPIREAFQRLATEGVLMLEDHRGARVMAYKDRFQESYLLLQVLLSFGVGVAVEKLESEDIGELRRILAEYEEGVQAGASQQHLYEISQSFSNELLRLSSLPMTAHMTEIARSVHSEFHSELSPREAKTLDARRIQWMNEVISAIDTGDTESGKRAIDDFGKHLYRTFMPRGSNAERGTAVND